MNMMNQSHEEINKTMRILEAEREGYLDDMVYESRVALERQHDIENMRREMEWAERFEGLNLPQENQIEEPAPPVVAESRKERKKREEREKASAMATEQANREAAMVAGRSARRIAISVNGNMSSEDLRQEREVCEEKLKTTRLIEKSRLLDAGDDASEDEKLQIRWEEEDERAKILRDYARILPIGSEERAEAMKRKEAQELRADKLRRQLKVMRIADRREREREEKTLARHAKFDAMKAVFRKENPLSHEDSTYIIRGLGEQGGDMHLINIGRAFFGGTKPMYIFEDRNAPILDDFGEVQGYQQYLYKEAINCLGFDKPQGALVTTAAAKLQDKICGPYSIPAYTAEQDGRVIGSFQKMIDSLSMETDLFQWQANPQAHPPLEKNVTDEILREHTLDWLLCNFDTKGENFLMRREDGHLCSIDKEASFSKLKDGGAAHMSTDYKPHSNDTIYNTIFREYAAGRQELDLSTVTAQILKAEQITDEEYLWTFDAMLAQKYGRRSARNRDRQAAEDAILARKINLRAEYRVFFTDLVNRRHQALMETKGQREEAIRERLAKQEIGNEEANRELQLINDRYGILDDTAKFLNPQTGQFRFADE
ncbi:MAG: hypothetical protein HFE61_08885 [Anaerotignum sp.]|jgi:hypothetical protein|nr:hypothetical protein [Anaerotignum sp.]